MFLSWGNLTEALKPILNPIYFELKSLRKEIMAGIADLNAAIEDQYNTVLPVLEDQEQAFNALRDEVANGASREAIADSIARLAVSTNKIREGIRSLADSPSTPDAGEVVVTPLPEEPPVVESGEVPATPGNDEGNVPEGADPLQQ